MNKHNNKDLSNHYTNVNYFGAKCLLLFSYYSLLHYMGLGLEFKLLSFMIITPIVKFFYLKDFKTLIISLIIDAIVATTYFKYLIHWDGLWLAFYPFLVAFWLIITEYIQFRVLGNPNESYVIKISNNPTDFLLTPIIAATYILVGLYLPQNLPITPYTYLFFVAMVIFVDWFFGITHYWLHTVPFLRKLHLVHHEYKKEDLNTMANFYADFWDSLAMNITNVAFSIATVLFVQNPIIIKELIYIAFSTHHKYPTNTFTSFYFFEIEVIDMITSNIRMSDFHNAHHNEVDSYFALFGLFNDNHFVSITNSLKKVLPGVFGEVPKVKAP
jgi:sterol desaturase/sphingolipid hydroxylase (fatty acid hydroxylase superfamily)